MQKFALPIVTEKALLTLPHTLRLLKPRATRLYRLMMVYRIRRKLVSWGMTVQSKRVIHSL